ncbi:MAG: TIR domain-containing protein [Acidimicrobiales bacterium]
MSESDGTTPAAAKRRAKISQADIPAINLEKAVRVPRALVESYGSDPAKPLDVAAAVDMSPTSGPFRTMCGAAVGYGLTEGGPNAPLISLQPLGKRVVTPMEVEDDRRALREAAMKPTVANRFYAKYDGSSLPPKNIAQNVLASFDVPAERTSDVYDLLIENARFVGFIKKIKDKEYLDTGAPIVNGTDGRADELTDELGDEGEAENRDNLPPKVESNDDGTEVPPPESRPSHKNAIFVGHGSNREPMDQLLKILDEYSIPHKQAVDEPNRARPIPQKVADVMRECGAAILVFTADKEYFDKDGNSIWRPSENVSHELGAASVLYGDRIVVFKEKGIELPSNFSSVGYIEFEKDKLGEKGIELFRELVSMKIVSISVG